MKSFTVESALARVARKLFQQLKNLYLFFFYARYLLTLFRHVTLLISPVLATSPTNNSLRALTSRYFFSFKAFFVISLINKKRTFLISVLIFYKKPCKLIKGDN